MESLGTSSLFKQVDQHLLSTNDPPMTNEQRLAAKRYIDAVSKEIQEREAAIQFLPPLPGLRRRIGKLRKTRRKVQGILSPLRDFPEELIARIFEIVLEPWNNNLGGRRAFIRLRSVCQRWRAIAFSHPALWAALTVEPRELFGPNAPDLPQAKIRAWFDRALATPLRFQIYSSNGFQNTAEEVASAVSVVADDRNWSVVKLSLDAHAETSLNSLFAAIASASYRPWKNLKTLEIALVPPSATTAGGTEHWPFGSLPLHFHAPNLSSLLMDVHTSLPESRTISHLNLSRLELSFRDRSRDVYASLICNLRHLPCLRWLKIRMGRSEPYSLPVPPAPIVHTGITTVILQGPPRLLQCLTLPALTHLWLSPENLSPGPQTDIVAFEEFSSVVKAFLHRSRCCLSGLFLHMWQLPYNLSSRFLEEIETGYITTLSVYLRNVLPEQAHIHRLLLLRSIRRIEIHGTAYIRLQPLAFIECLEQRKVAYLSSSRQSPGEKAAEAALPWLELVFKQTAPFVRDRNRDLLARAFQLKVRIQVGSVAWN
ncbi:hypothetical protein CC2G_008657 [Coprinopsis cinerea AmutBmut pab1-1]|nr:hypothetical protein CC2G_008657 [Coprinopsis cinerea AmutBmut pab1-1]